MGLHLLKRMRPGRIAVLSDERLLIAQGLVACIETPPSVQISLLHLGGRSVVYLL